MQLDKYISETIYCIAKAINDADAKLQEETLGEIWRHEFNTLAKYLVTANLAKGKDPDTKESVPVLLLEYDVNLIVADKKEKADSKELGAGAQFLQVFNLGGKYKDRSGRLHTEEEIQNLKFTIPIRIKNK